MLINGEWVRAVGKTFESRNPATGELLAMVAEGDKEDIDRAVAAARRAFEGPWSKFKPYERQALLLKIADIVEKNYDELSLLDTVDMGAPSARTRGTKQRVLGMLRWYAGMATSIHGETIENSLPGEYFSFTLKEPIGVVGAIIPWNDPGRLHLEDRPGAGHRLHRGAEAGRGSAADPAAARGAVVGRRGAAGVVNIVPGYGETAGAALAEHPGVDKVAFTGSHLTGQSIVRASAGNPKRVSLELGGKSPDIVFADADLETAVPGAGMAVFANSGQICSAGTRLFVERKVYDEFVAGRRFRQGVEGRQRPRPETQIGPLVSEQQFNGSPAISRPAAGRPASVTAAGR